MFGRSLSNWPVRRQDYPYQQSTTLVAIKGNQCIQRKRSYGTGAPKITRHRSEEEHQCIYGWQLGMEVRHRVGNAPELQSSCNKSQKRATAERAAILASSCPGEKDGVSKCKRRCMRRRPWSIEARAAKETSCHAPSCSWGNELEAETQLAAGEGGMVSQI